jgi:hypothetical protein
LEGLKGRVGDGEKGSGNGMSRSMRFVQKFKSSNVQNSRSQIAPSGVWGISLAQNYNSDLKGLKVQMFDC